VEEEDKTLPEIFMDGGPIFPLAARDAGTYTSNPILMSEGVLLPFSIFVVTDVDLDIYFDLWLDDQWRTDAFNQAVTGQAEPTILFVSYALQKWRMRVVAVTPSNFSIQVMGRNM